MIMGCDKSEFYCVIVMENTVLVQVLKVCNTVKPSLVFHTGGMFVILINVSIFRMSTGKKTTSLYILKLSADSRQGAVCLVFG